MMLISKQIVTGLLAVAAGVAAGRGWAAPAPDLDRLLDSAAARDVFEGVAISPDGTRVAWTEELPGPKSRTSEAKGIFWADLAATAPIPRRITALPAGSSGAAPSPVAATVEEGGVWSPDGQRLAFLSDATSRAAAGRRGGRGRAAGAAHAAGAADGGEAPGQLQIWVTEPAGGGAGAARQLTHLTGRPVDLRWSPDGKAIAFLFIANRLGAAGPLQPSARDAGVVGETPEEQRLAIVELASGEVRQVSPPDLYVYEYDWSPDGRRLAAIGAHGSGDDNWWIAELYVLAAAGAEPPRSILKPSYQMANPRWSPDSGSIAFIGGLMSDQGLTGGDVYAIPADGGAARDLTSGLAASASWLAWTSPSQITFVEIVDGDTAIATLDPASGRVASLWRASGLVSLNQHDPGLALARDGRSAAVILQSFARPPEVWAGPIGGWRQLTRRNADLQPAWGEAKKLHWASDGATVQGWLLAPPPGPSLPEAAGGAAGKHPMVVLVHGGPASAHHAAWPQVAGTLASQGFYVLLPNPRGSYGQGEEFTRGNVKDFGYGDLRDILGGVEAAVREAPVDAGRVGIYGWSYGGYMVMWAVTRGDRFRAAVAGAGVANWQSYYGQNRIDKWMIPYFGATVYEDPWIYARSSPITFIDKVKTPTLILQGELDSEVPAPQAYEFWHALKTLGIETQLVIYPGVGHHLDPPSDRDRIRRVLDWFAAHLR
jgi:dipeptidyl aminopeptidase/acylaminoacyl peptidase